MNPAADTTAESTTKLVLIVGYVSLVGGVLAAYLSPANGYETSIYGSTPAAFWLALLVVFAVAIAVSMQDNRHLPLALLLGGLGAASFVGLPLVRGYHFYGRSDSLVHLGWTRALDVGGDPFNLVYPGSHLISVTLSNVAGIEVTQAMMLVMWLYVLLFFLCVPLCVWFIVPDRRSLTIGAFSGFLLLPVNNVSTYLHFHTYSITMLFVPLVLYLVFTHLVGGEPRKGAVKRLSDGGRVVRSGANVYENSVRFGIRSFEPVPTSYLLPIVFLAIVLFHPQVALNVLIFLLMVVAVQFWYRRFRPQQQLASYRLLVVQTAFLLVVFTVWISFQESALLRTADALVDSVVNFIAGTGETTPQVDSQTDSAESIGVSIWELFGKMFAIGAVYSLLAAGVVLGKITGLLGQLDEGSSLRSDVGGDIVKLFFFGTLALAPFFAVHLLGSISTYLFRHVGFSMVLVTILGAVGVRYLLPDGDGNAQESSSHNRITGSLKGLTERLGALGGGGRPIAVAVVILVLALSLATVFPSPYTYQSGSHVPEEEMNGYQAAFASQSPETEVWFSGVRTTSERYEQALYGAESAPWDETVEPPPKKSNPVPETAMLEGMSAYYVNHPELVVRRDHYFHVSTADYEREVNAYGGLRYSEASFESVEAQPEVGKVRDNGGFTIYYVNIPDDASWTESKDIREGNADGDIGITGNSSQAETGETEEDT